MIRRGGEGLKRVVKTVLYCEREVNVYPWFFFRGELNKMQMFTMCY